MIRLSIIVVVLALLLLATPALCRKRTVSLATQGKIVAVARRPYVLPWKENEFGVYANNSKMFSLWGDAFVLPLFVYPFANGERFLCVYDDDTAVLVFVVDFAHMPVGSSKPAEWPTSDYARAVLTQLATNVVMNTKGQVRLPMFAELQEVSSNLASLTPKQYKMAAFPVVDFGLYRTYLPKELLLTALQTNRQAVWPW